MRNLIDVMNLPTDAVEQITLTSDGHYLGRAFGDCGFNMFFGTPEPSHPGPGRDRSRAVFRALRLADKKQVVRWAQSVGVDLRAFVGPRELRDA